MDLVHAPRDVLRAVRSVLQPAVVRATPIKRGVPHTLPGKLVVSLTSYPPRFPTLDLTLRRLLSQDVAPDELVLWIAHQDRASLPRRVEHLQEHGLTIGTCEDLRSYKKIVPALGAYPDAFIAICDDDTNYPTRWLRALVEGYRDPQEVVCHKARRFAVDLDGQVLRYENWPSLFEEEAAGRSVLPIGFGGVLYPPGSLPPETLDAERFMRLCPHGDDLWLFWLSRLAGCTARRTSTINKRFGGWPGTQSVALWRRNDLGGGCDRQIAAMIRAYGLPGRRATSATTAIPTPTQGHGTGADHVPFIDPIVRERFF